MIPLNVVVKSDTSLQITIGTGGNTLSGVNISFGTTNVSYTTAGTAASISSIPSDTTQILIGGILNPQSFAFSVNIDMYSHTVQFNGTFDSNGNFDPIGTSSSPFTGVFDGNGYTISGIQTVAYLSSSAHPGLFGYVGNGGEISDLGVVNSSVFASLSSLSSSAYASAGGIVGYASSSTITNCYNTGSVSASTQSAGGIVGYASSSTITNCYNTGSVSASSSSLAAFAGGVVGVALSSTITDCYNTGSVSASTPSAGGIVGYASTSTITNCYNTGSVSAPLYAGGIVGDAESSTTLTITNCYNTGSVSGASAGGIVGDAESSTITNCYNTGSVSASLSSSSNAFAGGVVGIALSSTITDCYNTGSVSASLSSLSNAYAGGVVGYASTSTIITNCYYLIGQLKINGSAVSDKMVGYGSAAVDSGIVTPARKTAAPDQRSGAKTSGEMRPSLSDAQNNNSIYLTGTTTPSGKTPITGWDFTNVWVVYPNLNGGYPILRSLADSVLEYVHVSSITVTGSGGATITSNGGTLQMSASVLPSNATDRTVTWSVTNGTGTAVISQSGLLTAVTNGMVTVRATANNGSGVFGELTISISGQTAEPRYMIIYVANNGSGSILTEDNKITGRLYNLADTSGLTVPVGKHFKEWNTAPDGSGTSYLAGQQVTITGNLMLYAVWADVPATGGGGLGLSPIVVGAIVVAAIAVIGGAAYFLFIRKR